MLGARAQSDMSVRRRMCNPAGAHAANRYTVPTDMDRAPSTGEERELRVLRASEEQLRAIFNSEPECVKVVDPAGRVLEMNAAGLAMLEADTIDQVRGTRVADFVHPDDVAAVESLIARAAAGERGTVTFRMRTFKGNERWAESHTSPVRTGAGEIHAVVAVTHDVTARRRAREERDLYAQAMRAMNVGLIVMRLETTDPAPVFRVTAANEAALRYARLREDELVGSTMGDLFPALGADVIGKALDVLHTQKAAFFGDLPYADGRIPPLVVTLAMTPISDRSLALTYQDVTEQRRAADQLQQWQKMEAIGRLAGGVAHDFNNLLTIIIGYVQTTLAHPAVPDELRSQLEQIHAAADRAASLTRQLLAFSRRQVLQPRVVDVDAELRHLVPMIIPTVRQDIVLTLALESAGACMRVDPAQLEQVVMNLIMNACDAMPSGGRLLLRTDRTSDDGQGSGPAVRITVSDTGTGMDAVTRSRLFEPFFTTKGERGTGLGLSTVYGIVKQSGGSVTCESQPGAGSSFHLSFPLVAEAPAAVEPPLPRDVRGSERVLVVEDQAALRRLMVVSLERAGYQVDNAANGDEALALVRSGTHFDVLVTDLVMPGMNGRQVADAVSRLSPQTRLVFVSGYFHDPDVGESLVHFLPKPFTPAALTAMVRKALDAPEPRRQ